MNKTEHELEEIIDDADIDLHKAIMALEEFINEYVWSVKPTAAKANKYGSSIGGRDCSLDEEISWKLLTEYDKIKWLIQIAHDYCWSALENLQKKNK